MFKKQARHEKGVAALEFSIAAGAAAVLLGASALLPNPDAKANSEETILAAVLNELQDITIDSPVAGDTLVWDGTGWVNGILNLSDLGTTNFNSPQEGDVLMFDGTNWFNSTPAAPTLENLDGVNIDETPSLGNSLVWDGTEWVNSTSGIPGEIKLWTVDGAPDGWLIADGRAVSRTTYADLFAIVGETYGAGDGTTTFNLPDLSGNIPVGFSSTDSDFGQLGKTGGMKEVALTVSQMPSHTHIQNAHSHAGSSSEAGAHTHTATAASGGAHTHTGTSTTAGNHNHRYAHGSGGNSRYNKRSTNCCGKTSTEGRTSSSAGAHTHTVSSTSAGAHTHTVTINNGGAHTHDVTTSDTIAVNNETGGSEAHSNLMPYTTVDYIIRH